MGVAFEAPLALLLLIPALALTIALHLGRAPAHGCGATTRRPRRPGGPPDRARVRHRRLPAGPAGRPARDRLRRRPLRFGRQRGREDALAFLRETLKEKPAGDVAGIVAFGKDALVERLPSELEEIDRIASTPVKSATDIGAALRLATALFPDDAQKRIVLLSDGNDTTGSGQAEAALAASRGVRDRDPPDRPRRRRRGPRRAADHALDRPPRRVGRGGRRDPLLGRAAGDGPPLRRRRPGRDAAGQPRRRRHAGHVRRQADRGRASTPSGPSSRRPATRSARTTAPTRTPSSRASRGRSSWPATTRSPPSSSPALQSQRQQVDTIVPEALPTDFAGLATYDSVVLVDVPRIRLSDRQLAALQVYVRDLGKGLVMVGGPDSYGAGGYQKTPLEETLPVDMGVRDRQKQPDIALVVVIDKSGSMAACHCNTFDRGSGSGIAGVQKVDIGKEAILRAAAAMTERDELGVVAFNEAAHWVVQTQPLGEIGDLQGQIAGIRADGQTNIFAGLDQAVQSLEGVDRDPPPHHPADRRLVDLGPVRRDPGQDEGRRDHPLDGRRGRRREPVPRAAGDSRAAAGSTRPRTRRASPTSSSRRPSRSPASRSSRSRSSRS